MSKYTNSMFEEIKTSLKNNKNRDGGIYLRFEPVNTYIVRLLPNFKNFKNTILNYYFHMFNSHVDGTSINFTCPTTYKDKCTACTLRFKLYRNGGEIDKKLSAELSRKAKSLVNAYVISDPVNPQNNGKVKVIRFGKQLATKINSAIDGEDSEEFGKSIFDLSENGCNFRIKVEESSTKGENSWPTYVNSKFLSKSKIEGMTEEKMEEIYNSTFDLDTLITSIEPNKINKLIQEHFLQITPENKKASVENESVDTSSSQTEEVEDNEKEDSKDSSTSTNEESTNQTHELNKLDEKREDVLKTQESLKTESPDEIQKKIDDLLEGI